MYVTYIIRIIFCIIAVVVVVVIVSDVVVVSSVVLRGTRRPTIDATACCSDGCAEQAFRAYPHMQKLLQMSVLPQASTVTQALEDVQLQRACTGGLDE